MENTLQHIFSTDYNQDAFFSGVLHYVFGEDNINKQEFPEEFVKSDADRNLTEAANILSIKKIGSIGEQCQTADSCLCEFSGRDSVAELQVFKSAI